MSASDDSIVLVTMRTDHNRPTPEEYGGSVLMSCDECHHEVHVSNSSLELFSDKQIFPKIMCMVCAIESGGMDSVDEFHAVDKRFQHILEGEGSKNFRSYMREKYEGWKKN